jgi:hypothetical protein
LRLSFVTVGADLIERGVAAVAAALRDLREGRAEARPTSAAARRAEVAP